ncbi:MAG: hypothetical protein AAF889_02315, partial [Cyanobacteria bacterium P01_D01_bin.73]
MKLKSRIDKDIQIDLMFHRITFPVDKKGKILIHQFRIDTQAGAGTLYIKPKEELPGFEGAQKEVTIPSSETCDVCEGTGAAKGTSPVTCTTCGGVGRVRAQQGFFTVER